MDSILMLIDLWDADAWPVRNNVGIGDRFSVGSVAHCYVLSGDGHGDNGCKNGSYR